MCQGGLLSACKRNIVHDSLRGKFDINILKRGISLDFYTPPCLEKFKFILKALEKSFPLKKSWEFCLWLSRLSQFIYCKYETLHADLCEVHMEVKQIANQQGHYQYYCCSWKFHHELSADLFFMWTNHTHTTWTLLQVQAQSFLSSIPWCCVLVRHRYVMTFPVSTQLAFITEPLKLLEGSDLFQRFTSFCACRQQQPSLYCIFCCCSFLNVRYISDVSILITLVYGSPFWNVWRKYKMKEYHGEHFHEAKGKEWHNKQSLQWTC